MSTNSQSVKARLKLAFLCRHNCSHPGESLRYYMAQKVRWYKFLGSISVYICLPVK